jgi:hypothetical protein
MILSLIIFHLTSNVLCAKVSLLSNTVKGRSYFNTDESNIYFFAKSFAETVCPFLLSNIEAKLFSSSFALITVLLIANILADKLPRHFPVFLFILGSIFLFFKNIMIFFLLYPILSESDGTTVLYDDEIGYLLFVTIFDIIFFTIYTLTFASQLLSKTISKKKMKKQRNSFYRNFTCYLVIFLIILFVTVGNFTGSMHSPLKVMACMHSPLLYGFAIDFDIATIELVEQRIDEKKIKTLKRDIQFL